MSARRRARVRMPRRVPLMLFSASAAGVLWQQAGEPEHLAGFAAALVLALAAGPVLVMGAVLGVPALALAAVPCTWRVAWRAGLPRPGIAAAVRRAVLAADRHRCLYCGSGDDPQLDHVRPWSAGGLSVLWNLAVLCRDCNAMKSNYWRYRSGLVVYRGWPGSDDALTAALILAAERRDRLNPARWIRAAWSLSA